ncbi:hypothetical protein ACFM35_15930 [Microbacterium sp. P01]|uniref:hypothetical protein n=1 Tax=Microbacterium sp. P01 TaxID=3366261 RepID=UPI00366D715B
MNAQHPDVHWLGYVSFEMPHFVPFMELDRAQARETYQQVMESRQERRRMLRSLLTHNGFATDPENALVESLDTFLCTYATRDSENPAEMEALWYAVAFDVALTMGDIIVARDPTLKWALRTTGKSTFDYHTPVIVGFQNSPIPNRAINVIMAVAGNTHSAAVGNPRPGFLREMLEQVHSEA